MSENLRGFLEEQFNTAPYQRLLVELPTYRFIHLTGTPLLHDLPEVKAKVVLLAFRPPLTNTPIKIVPSVLELPQIGFYTISSGGLDFAYLLIAPITCLVHSRENHCAIVPKKHKNKVGPGATLKHQNKTLSILSDEKSVLLLLNNPTVVDK